MKKEISEYWKMMPIFNWIHKDTLFDESYVFVGLVFLYSIMILPLTLPLYLIGKLLEKIFTIGEK